MPWSRPIPLSDYSDAPNERGVYQIGFGTAQFEPKYVGRAMGGSTTIRTRLSAHYNLSGNNHITAANRDGLTARWIQVSQPDCTEARMLKKHDFPWNEKHVRDCDSD